MRKVLIVVVILAIMLVGYLLISKPRIEEIKYSWGKVNESTTEIIVNVKVYNPNPFPIPLKDVIMDIYMNGIKMGEGHAIKANIPANSESTIVVAIYLDNSKIPKWWVSHIRNGEETTVNVKGDLVFDLKLFEFKFPIGFSRTIKTNILSSVSLSKPETISIDNLANIEIRSVNSRWGNVNDKWTEIVTTADVYNPNTFPINVISFDYTIRMNGILVGNGSEYLNTVIPPKSDAKLKLVTKIMNDRLKDWWVTHIKNGERTKVEIDIKPKVKVAGREISFTLTKQTFEIRTDFLG